jgi:hypothetical protein
MAKDSSKNDGNSSTESGTTQPVEPQPYPAPTQPDTDPNR